MIENQSSRYTVCGAAIISVGTIAHNRTGGRRGGEGVWRHGQAALTVAERTCSFTAGEAWP
jgi:hypothetical protein